MTVVRPFELSDGRLMIQLITLGPGLCGGDSVRIDVHAQDGARVVVTTTAASRIMSMEDGAHAEQHVTLRAGHQAALEYYPSVTIPFPGSALTQTVRVEAEATSRVEEPPPGPGRRLRAHAGRRGRVATVRKP